MIFYQKTLPFFVFLLLSSVIWAQEECTCTILEVENNTVTPCDLTIGTIITVSTTNELRNAIIQVNNAGGNMTILIEDGTYQIASTAWYPYITASNLVIRSVSGNRDAVILTGHGMVSVGSGTEIGLYAVGDNITIADLTIKDLGNHGIASGGDNLWVHNVKIQDTFEQMLKGNNTADGLHNSKVQCSLFEYTAGVGPQWYIGGIDVHGGHNWIVKDNIFKNIASPSVSWAEHAIHFWDNSSDNIIERNQAINCDRGIGFGLGSSANEGGIIRNNMIYNDGTGLFNDVGIGLESSPGTKVYNNTIHIAYFNAIEYRFAETVDVDITNNLTNQAIKSRNGGQATLATNVESGEGDWYVDMPAGNLRLASNNSTLVNQGTTLAEVMFDIDQTPRPQETAFDIGAYEMMEVVATNDKKEPAFTVTLSPNPAMDVLRFQSEIPAICTVKIYNNIGQEMITLKNKNLSTGLNVDVSEWKNGAYYYWIIGEEVGAVKGKVMVIRNNE